MTKVKEKPKEVVKKKEVKIIEEKKETISAEKKAEKQTIMEPKKEAVKFVPKKQQKDELDFESQKAKKKHRGPSFESDESFKSCNEDDSDDDRVPLYLALCLPKTAFEKIKQPFTEAVLDLQTRYFAQNVMKHTCESLLEMIKDGSRSKDGWRFVPDFHVTCQWVGRDDDKEVLPNFKNNQMFDVEIMALVVVPDKIVTGVCFPGCEVENKCPHVTIALNQWEAVMSNALLEKSCLSKNAGFSKAYHNLREGKPVKDDK